MALSLQVFTLVHVAISLVGIGSGLIVVVGLLTRQRFSGWTALFLLTTVATSVTGFFFPVHRFMPSHAVGILSLLVLALAIYGRYVRRLSGGWRKIYVIGAMIALYLNVFVLVVQLFAKVPALKDLAPTGSEPPFKVTQLVVLSLFIVIGIVATIRFHDQPAKAA